MENCSRRIRKRSQATKKARCISRKRFPVRRSPTSSRTLSVMCTGRFLKRGRDRCGTCDGCFLGRPAPGRRPPCRLSGSSSCAIRLFPRAMEGCVSQISAKIKTNRKPRGTSSCASASFVAQRRNGIESLVWRILFLLPFCACCRRSEPAAPDASSKPDIVSATPEVADPAARAFLDWLDQHPEVFAVSAVPYDQIKRFRYSTADQTIIGAVKDARAVCASHPAPVRTMWSQETKRRSDGHPVAGVAIGPLPDDAGHAAAFEFRFPEATVHPRP